jgi:N-acetyl-anhydromuramyl-L-alanine amidase AmpD
MDGRILLPLLVLPFLARRTDSPTEETERGETVPHAVSDSAPPIESIALPTTFRKMSERTASLDAIVLHCTEGGGDARKSALHALRPVEEGGRKASFHNVIGRDGTIVQLVPWERQAWHCTSLPGLQTISWNNRSIGIELCALPTQNLTAPQERALVRLVRYLLRRYAIPWQNVTAHRFTGANTSCPDSLWRTRAELTHWKQKHLR